MTTPFERQRRNCELCIILESLPFDCISAVELMLVPNETIVRIGFGQRQPHQPAANHSTRLTPRSCNSAIKRRRTPLGLPILVLGLASTALLDAQKADPDGCFVDPVDPAITGRTNTAKALDDPASVTVSPTAPAPRYHRLAGGH